MNGEYVFRTISSVIFGLLFAFIVFSNYNNEKNSQQSDQSSRKYQPYVSGFILPTYVITFAILGILSTHWKQAAQEMVSFCFHVFLHISIYYLVLILLLPILRKNICARACATLWIIPNYLYITQQETMELPAPWLVITTPGNLIWFLFFLWIFGFVIILGWKIIEHISFRRHILQDSVPVSDPEILSLWQTTLDNARMRDFGFQLVVSDCVHTPLTIGLWYSRTVVVLPRNSYTPEELELIFQHEIIHIGRGDAWTKFFLIFCTAMCWFNPLMWFAMKTCSEDLELSCDETVLLDANPDTHKRYAMLLLDNASDGRGFTTCLAASVQSMRYRLKRIMQPAVRRSGALVVGFTFFLLCMTNGYVALAYDAKSGQELLSQYGDPSQFTIRPRQENVSAESLVDALSALTFYDMTGNYSFSGMEYVGSCVFTTPKGSLNLILHDHAIRLTVHSKDGYSSAQYYVPEEISWICDSEI